MKIPTTAFLTLLAATASAFALTIEEGDPLLAADRVAPLFRVSAPTYSADISADGSLSISVKSGSAGAETLVKSLIAMRGASRIPLGAITRDGDSITLLEGAPADAMDALGVDAPGDAPAPAGDAPGLRLSFTDESIGVEPHGGDFLLCLGIGDDAIGLVNSRTGTPDALPTTRYAEGHIFSFYEHIGNCWPDVELVGACGAGCMLTGIDGVRPAQDFRIFPQDVVEALPNGVAAIGIGKEGGAFSIKPVPPPADSVRRYPVPACTASPARRHGLFPADEPARFILRFPDGAPAGRYRLEWGMSDHVQRPLGTGATTFELDGETDEVAVDIVPADAPPGYVYAQGWLARDDVPSAIRHLTFEFGRCNFENDLVDRLPPWDMNEEVHLMNLLGFRGIRLAASLPSIWLEFRKPDDPETIDWDAFKSKWQDLLAYCDMGAISRPMMIMEGPGANELDAYFKEKYGAALPEAGADGAGSGGDTEEDGAVRDPDARWEERRDDAVSRWYREFGAAAQELDLLWWEPFNEPDLQMPQENYVETILKPIYDDFKAGGPRINFLGGSCCGLDKQPWVDRLYEVDDEGRHFDGISFHPYTGVGFQRIYRMELAKWRALFAAHGDDPKQGLFMTEAANHRGWGYNIYTYDRFGGRRESHAHTGLHMILHAEAFGIPRQHVYVFYACEHGYNDFFLVRRDGPTPSAIAFQAMNAALGDAVFDREIPLPGHDHFFQRYRGDGRTVAAMFTAGDTVTARVYTDADSLALIDCMGVRKELVPEKGIVEVAFDNFPVFLSGPDGARLEPVYGGLQVKPNIALAALGAKVSTDAEKDPGSPEIDVVIDGDWTGYVGGCWSEGEAGAGPDGAGVFPDTFEIALPEAREVDSVTIYHQYGAWERTLRDFDIEAFVDGEWKKVAETRGNYYSEVTAHGFPPVKTDRLRLVVTGVNRCLFETIPWIKAQTALRAIEVRAVAERPALAFFADQVLDKPKVPAGGSLELEYRLVNATAKAVEGELAFTLPEGWGASPVSVSIPAKGEKKVKAAFTAGGEAGLATVVAGLHDGDGNLVSSDYDVRIVQVEPVREPSRQDN